MVYNIVTAFSPWIMSNNLLTDVVRIREEILPRFKTMWCWIISGRNSSIIGSRKSRHHAAYKTTYPSTPDTAATGGRRGAYPSYWAWNWSWRREMQVVVPGVYTNAGFVDDHRTTMSNKDSATVTGKFIIFILNVFLAVFGRKETCLNTLRLIMNLQSHIHTAPAPGQPAWPWPLRSCQGLRGEGLTNN